MFVFGNKNRSLCKNEHNGDCYGILLDIGSGSVMTAIIKSQVGGTDPEIIWYDRIMTAVKNIRSLQEDSLRPITVSLFTALLKLDSEGRKQLLKLDKKARLTSLYCTISAPWSKIVIKDINYSQDKPFLITKSLLQALEKKAETKIKTALKSDESWLENNLDLTDNNIIDLTANGYHIKNPFGQKASQLTLSQVNIVVHKTLSAKIRDLQEKMFPEIDLKITSFMLAFFSSLKTKSETKGDNYWLIDITREATEIALIRQGKLLSCDFTAFGQLSLARELAHATHRSIHEILSYLNSNNPYGFTKQANSTQKKEIEKIFSAYTKKIYELFDKISQETEYSANKAIFHTDFQSEILFYHLLNESFTLKNNQDDKNFSLTPFSRTNLGQKRRLTSSGTYSDSALLVCSRFFHTNIRESYTLLQ